MAERHVPMTPATPGWQARVGGNWVPVAGWTEFAARGEWLPVIEGTNGRLRLGTDATNLRWQNPYDT